MTSGALAYQIAVGFVLAWAVLWFVILSWLAGRERGT